MGQITINPYTMTNAAGSFNIETTGVIVGTAYPDPATRFALAGGYLDNAAAQPIWGGCGISENIPTGPPAGGGPQVAPIVALGGKIDLATANGNLTGFCVFDQNYANINSPMSPVPQIPPGSFVSFYRLGSGARVALEIDPTLVSLEGGLITQAVGWDFANQKIIAGSGLTVKIIAIHAGNSMAPVFAPATGFLTWNRTATAAICVL